MPKGTHTTEKEKKTSQHPHFSRARAPQYYSGLVQLNFGIWDKNRWSLHSMIGKSGLPREPPPQHERKAAAEPAPQTVASDEAPRRTEG